MKKLLIIALLFVGCEKDSPTESSVHPLVGVWNQTEYTTSNGTTALDENMISTYIFNEDNTYNYDSIDWDELGTWSTNDNKLTTIDTERNDSIIRDYSISGDVLTMKALVDYTINRHYPNLKGQKNPALALLKAVMEKQIKLIINWMRVGFVHGVMNTDNMAISGETIDYGPCAFMDTYDPQTVFSSIDHYGRYAYANQPAIAHWNLSRLAEILLPLIHDKKDKAIKIAEENINSFSAVYKKHWLEMMRKKLGLFKEENKDEKLITALLSWMQKNKADFTNTFLFLMKEKISKDELFQDNTFLDWYKQWEERLKQNKKPVGLSLNLMKKNNPLIIPRNHKVEEALEAASINGDLQPMFDLHEVLKNPYNNQPEIAAYQNIPEPNEQVYKTFCGT